jgi:subtilase family serine protease
MLPLAATVSVGLAVFWGIPPASAAGHGGPATSPVGFAPAVPAGAVLVGPTPGSKALHFDIVLNPRHPAQLGSFALAVSTPGSPERGHFLTVRQFAARFGQAPATLEAAETALSGIGLKPGQATRNGLVIPLYTTFGQAAASLHTTFVNFRLSSGRIAFANTSAPRLPSSLARLTVGIMGLDNLAVPVIRPPSASRRAGKSVRGGPEASGPQPCEAAIEEAESRDGWTYNQLASAYGLTSLYTDGYLGQGVRVALFEIDPWALSDAESFESCYGIKVPITAVSVDGGAGTGSGEGEAALDMDTIMGLAPRAKLTVYDAPPSGSYATDVVDEYTKILDNNKAQIISSSYGLCEPYVESEYPGLLASENNLFQEAAAQGVSVFAASGDTGSEGCYRADGNTTELATLDQSSQPYVTGVGGTDLSSVSPRSEVTWNESPDVGGGASGGGISNNWDMPSWQSGPGVINSYTSGSPCGNKSGYCREIPDVSANADWTANPYIIYYNGEWTWNGGTSAATPLWAAVLADIESETYTPPPPWDPTTTTAERLGFMNPTFYSAAAAGSSGFNDITSGDNDWTGENGGKYPATSHYDLATGLGSPYAPGLASSIFGPANIPAQRR